MKKLDTESMLDLKLCERCGSKIDIWKGRTQPNQIRKRKFCSTCGKARRIEVSRPKRLGKTYNKGYVMVWYGDRKVLEHVLKAETVLGRRLKRGELVHHINGDPSDNRNCNLLICNKSYHNWLHNEMSRRYQQEKFGHL